MAEKLKKYEFKTAGRGSSYPWDEWFDGGIWKLEQGVDFKSKVASFRQSVLRAAKKRDLKVRTSIEGEALVIQAQGHRS